MSSKPVTLKRNELIARVEIILESFGLCEINKIEIEKPLQPFTLSDLSIGDITKDHKIKLLELVNSYRDCFATTLSELGRTEIEKMRIDVSDDQPVVYRPYRLSQKERQEVQSMVDELSSTGLIRESSSPYASPVILVRKKTGDMIPRVARWWSLIQEFDCDVKYKPGQGMSHVDALSRNAIANNSSISKEWLRTVQSSDNEIERIRNILQNSDIKDMIDIKQNYCIKNNNIYRVTKNGTKWLVPKGVRWHILKACHDDIGHFSLEKTLDRIQKSYLFPKMKKFVSKYVQSCLECAHSKIPSGKKSGYLHPIPKIPKPFHTLHADHLGPFNISKRKNKYLLVIIDSYSRFIIKPVKNTKAFTTIRAFKEYFATFGCPVRLITDRYSSFTGKKFENFLKEVGVKHVMNAVATPRANGHVERYNRTILDSLTAMNHGRDESDWDSKVLDVQWGLNNTINKGIGRNPAEVLFGLNLTSMAESRILSSINDEDESLHLEKNLNEIRTEVNKHIDKTQKEQKQRFDKSRVKPRKFQIGDLVRVERPILCPGKSKKLMVKC